MISKKFFHLAGFALIAMVSCKNNNHFSGYEKSENGLYSKFYITHEGARKPKIGEYASISITYYNGKDSLIFNSSSLKEVEHGIIAQPVFKPTFKGSFEEALTTLAVGDSASFKISADSVYLKTFGAKELPKFIEKGSYLTFYVKLHSVQTQQERFNEFSEKEKQALQAYIKDNNITVQPTESGLYFIEKEAGKGAVIKAGQTASVKYSGKLLNGTVFDASERHGDKAFDIKVGEGQVIKGWDEALLKLKKGGKAQIILPSSLAYGVQGGGPIPPFSPLVFDLEVVDVK